MEMIVDVRTQVHECLRFVAEREGFHRIDADFGQELAETESLRPAQVVVATKLLHSYQHQFKASGLVVPDEGTVTSWAAEHTLLNDDEMQVLLSDVTPSLEPIITPINKVEDGTHASELVKEEPINLVSVQYGRIFVEFPFNQSKVNALRPLKDGVEDWAFNRYKRNEWSYPVEAADVVFEALRAFHDFTYSPEVMTMVMHAYQKRLLERQVSDLEEHWHELAQIAVLEAAQPYLDGAPVANGQRLFRHQREAVQRMIEAQRFILALDMGLGKSRAALIAAEAYDLPIWVIAPAGTIINWQREAAAAGVEITLYSWAKLPDPPEHLDYVLIVDEAHYAQGGEETIRGKNFLRLAEAARAVFMLTGTPLKNSLPINLWPLLVAARHPLATDRPAYERLYCEGHYRSIGRKRSVYDTSGASNLDELHERTKDVILYRKKSECVDLPDKLRVPRLAEVSNAGELAYRKTIERLRQEHLERMADKYEALRVGLDDLLGEGTDESDLGEFESEYAFALVELGIYRHAASLAKVESAVEIAQEAIEQGQGVLLFTAFRDTAERLATRLEADCLTGEVTGRESKP